MTDKEEAVRFEDMRMMAEEEANACVWEQIAQDKLRAIPSLYRGGFKTLVKAHPRLKNMAAICLAWANGFTAKSPTRGLYLHGPVGSGKTGLIYGIAISLIKRHISVVTWPVPELLKAIQTTWHSDAEPTEYEILYEATEADLLILDDIGAESPSVWALQTLGQIVNRRYADEKTMIATSNLTLQKLTGRSNDLSAQRIGSRCCEMLADLPVPAVHLRGTQKEKP